MGMSGEKAQNQQANSLMASTNTAIDKASTTDPDLAAMKDYWRKIDQWGQGTMVDPVTGEKMPVDVRNIPGGDVDIGLFNAAKESHDTGRIGRGLGTMGDGVNVNYTQALDRELQSNKDIAASGMLENTVDSKLTNARAALTGLGTQQSQQNVDVAQLRSGLYRDYLNRPIKPSFGEQLAMGALSAVGQVGAGLASYGGLAAL